VLTESAMDGFDLNDRRGKEGITAEAVRKGLAAIEDDADSPALALPSSRLVSPEIRLR
jgi:hypothetical protein